MKNNLKEDIISPINGVFALFLGVSLIIAGVALGFVFSILAGLGVFLLGAFIVAGICVINPNEGVVLQLFGKYYGTVYENGVFFVNPFTSAVKVSLKRQNFSSEKVRTNDKRGNPIDLGVTVAWSVNNAAFAHYNVEDSLNGFIKEQVHGIFSEEAPKYFFDVNNDETNKNEIVFSRHGSLIANNLKEVLERKVKDVGISIISLNFSHCSYAKEIASAMLQNQQALAFLDARKTTVEGAYKLIEDLISKFSENKKVKLSDEDVAILTRNLMVVLVSEKEVTPTISLD